MRRDGFISSLSVIAVLAGVLHGCSGRERHGVVQAIAVEDLQAWSPEVGVFDPTRARVHPLTRVTRDAEGVAVLACHIELRDQSNQVVKCLGVVQVKVRLEAASEGGTPAAEDDGEHQWEVDLRDPVANADAFDDVVTRTYALRLGALPPSLARLADGANDNTQDDDATYRVDVLFIFKDAAGELKRLDASAVITEL